MPGISRTFATDVMCHPRAAGAGRRDPGPHCARFQLNMGHLLQRGPGSEDQWLHRDEAVWSDVRRPDPELQLASVIAFVDFTREGGATRVGAGQPPVARPGAQPGGADPRRPRPRRTRSPTRRCRPGPPSSTRAGSSTAAAPTPRTCPRRGAHLSYCLGWLRTEENNYLSCPPEVAATLPRQAQEVLGYAVHDGISRGGGYLGMVRMQDPVELLQRGELLGPT